MTWTDRVKAASYLAPDGLEYTFDYEDVSTSVDKQNVEYTFPDADGSYIQDLGRKGRRLPMRIFVWGDDYDLRATELEDAFLQPGAGRLTHPLYGTFDVVPFGRISRADNLKTAANQAVIDVTFIETIDVIYPTNQTDPGRQVLTSVDEFNAAAAGQYRDSTNLSSASDQSQLKGSIQLLVDNVDIVLGPVAKAQADAEQQFNAIRDSITFGIDELIGDPLTLAFQSALLIQAPARANTLATARLDAYQNLIDDLTTGENSIFEPGLENFTENLFRSNDLYVSSYISGTILSLLNNTFVTKPEAIEAAEFLLDQRDQWIEWRDANLVALSIIDTGEAYQQLIEAIGICAGFLIELSFTLKQEKSFVTVRPRNFVELVAELYGELDPQYDFFIDSNNLTGSEIIEIPAGREIVYYV